MNGIASLLDPTAYQRVEKLWDVLEAQCGFRGIRVTPFPHFTWQVTSGYLFPSIEETLQDIARETAPFTVHTSGIGIFSGENPVIYITIVKDEFLANLHRQIWEKTKGISIELNLLYQPSAWIPHITLIYNDLRQENIGCAGKILAFQSFEWEIRIDNLTLFGQPEGQTDLMARYRLGE